MLNLIHNFAGCLLCLLKKIVTSAGRCTLFGLFCHFQSPLAFYRVVFSNVSVIQGELKQESRLVVLSTDELHLAG